MPRMDSDEVTFHDASVYFSEKEWTLLQEWQKELYRNVMEEIHQALLSLGPLIMTAVGSLKTKEKKEPFMMANQSSESRTRIHHDTNNKVANHDVILNRDSKQALHLKIPPDSDGRERSSCSREGFQFVGNDIPLRKDEDSVFIDHLEAKMTGIRESNYDTSSGYEVVSFHIKDEAETFCMDLQDNSEIRINSSPSDDGNVNRKMEYRNSLNAGDKISSCIGSQVQTSLVHSSENDAAFGSYIWSDGHPDQCQTMVGYPKHCRLQQSVTHVDTSPPFQEHENATKKFKHLTCQPNVKDHFEAALYTEHEHNICQNEIPVIPQRLHKVSQSYSCIEREKNFMWEKNTITHQKIHLRERPYLCADCGKSFNKKAYLIRHKKIHTGERPFLCGECGKCFNQKEVLVRHSKIHTGEKPYCCAECGKDFIQKGHLIRHQKIHYQLK